MLSCIFTRLACNQMMWTTFFFLMLVDVLMGLHDIKQKDPVEGFFIADRMNSSGNMSSPKEPNKEVYHGLIENPQTNRQNYTAMPSSSTYSSSKAFQSVTLSQSADQNTAVMTSPYLDTGSKSAMVTSLVLTVIVVTSLMLAIIVTGVIYITRKMKPFDHDIIHHEACQNI